MTSGRSCICGRAVPVLMWRRQGPAPGSVIGAPGQGIGRELTRW